MHFDGSQYQNEIYITGESPWPVGADEWEARASEKLESGPFGYIAGGAGSEATVRANREAFESGPCSRRGSGRCSGDTGG